MDRFVAIVLSAGSGKRMGADIPKQYMDLKGKPIIYYSIKAFEDSAVQDIIIVTGESDVEFMKNDIVDKFGFNKVTSIVAGGNERYDSVYNGLLEARKNTDASYVMIHDGARPFVGQEVISSCMENVKKTRACIAGMPVKDTIKVVDDNNVIVDNPRRETLWQAQTPQCFELELAYKSYKEMIESGATASVTDDAMVVEKFGGVKVKMVEASYDNMKITTPIDIALGQLLV